MLGTPGHCAKRWTPASAIVATIVGLLVTSGLYVQQVDAQQSCSLGQFNGWQAYYSSWFTQYPSYAYYNMYPFGMYYCDNNATTSQLTSGFNPQINFNIPFYGTTYRSLWISPQGYVLFNDSLNLVNPVFSGYTPMKWPNQQYPTQGADPPFAAPFYAELNYYSVGNGPTSNQAAISWRVLDPTTQVSGSSMQSITLGMLNQITLDVQAATIGSMYFSAQRGLVLTYYNVTYSGASCILNGNPDYCPRNTFQIAIVTDFVSTYIVMNYFNITWIGGAFYQFCNPATGMPSYASNSSSQSYPCIPAQIGFNAGMARGFTALPYSGTYDVVNMNIMSGTNITGRWVYQINMDTIYHGGCTNTTWLSENYTWPLVAMPNFGPQFGGNVVNVSGPCFLPGMKIRCRFGNNDTYGVVPGYNWGDMMQVMCVQPFLYSVGVIELGVSTDGGQTYNFVTNYTVVERTPTTDIEISTSPVITGGRIDTSGTPPTVQQDYVPNLAVKVVSTNGDWLNPTTIQLTWNPLNLTSEWGNAVTIQLMGYVDQGWQVLYTFAFMAANSGTYTFTYSPGMCYSQNNNQICSQYDLGAFRVSLSNWQWDPYNPMAMWSTLVPLGWFMQQQVAWNEGYWWAQQRCQNWYNIDSQSTAWSTRLSPCPCTLNQSYVDFGNFQPTPDCNLVNSNKPGYCQQNQGAVACYQSTNVTSYGSSTRCCYNQFGNLMYSGDGMNGSISQRADPGGLYPFDKVFASVTHWQLDLLPWYYCCAWQTNPYYCFNLYMSLRPTQDCVGYFVPGHATTYGDPHINTPDAALYTFNGWGEYWLLQLVNAQIGGGSVTFSLQARFQQPPNITMYFGGPVQATVMSAVAMQLNGGTIVSVISNWYSYQEHMLVYVNSTLLNFSSPDLYYMSFPEFIVINHDLPTSKSYSNFTIAFRIGIGVNVAWNNGVMQMFATIPSVFMYQTNGLFGYWNGNPQNDLVPRGGSTNNPVSPNADQYTIYYSFGETWLVLPGETIFTYLYRANLNYNYYYNPWFNPYFQAQFSPNCTAVSSGQVSQLCQSDPSCTYDYMVTCNATVAANTYAITQWDTQLRQLGVTVLSCGWLNIPDAIRSQPVSYTVGSQVNILGCAAGFLESGTTYNYVCQQQAGSQSAQWSPAQIGVTCTYLNGALPWYEQIEIAVPIAVFGLGVIILIAVLFIILRRRRRVERREKRREKNQCCPCGGSRRTKKEATALMTDTNGPTANTAAAYGASIQLQPTPQLQSEANRLSSTPAFDSHEVVTGPIPIGYLSRSPNGSHSGTSTPSKISIHNGGGVSYNTAGNAALDRENGFPLRSGSNSSIQLSVNNLTGAPVAPPRSRSGSRPGTPYNMAVVGGGGIVNGTGPSGDDPNYATITPGTNGGPRSRSGTPASMRAAIVDNRLVLSPEPDAGGPADQAAAYYQRRYGNGMMHSGSHDSLV